MAGFSAVHEGAHGTVAVLEGLTVTLVSVGVPGAGRCRVQPPRGWIKMGESQVPVPADPLDPLQRAAIAPLCRFLLAGSIITGMYGRLRPDDLDMLQAVELVGQLGLYSERHEALYLLRLQRQTMNMLSSRWSAVLAVAEQLQRRGALLGSEIRAIVGGVA